jgi:hypothetical protein
MRSTTDLFHEGDADALSVSPAENILLTIEINFRDGEILDAYDANYLSPMSAAAFRRQ